jgi:hypothetical protein
VRVQARCKVLLLHRAANPCYSSSGTINGLSLYQSQQQSLSSSLQELCQVLGVLHTSAADVCMLCYSATMCAANNRACAWLFTSRCLLAVLGGTC